MANIRSVKLKAATLVFFAKFLPKFNRRIKGIETVYNARYAEGNGKFHKLDIMKKEGANGAPCVLYMHGGGWSAFDKDVFRTTCKRLSESGAVVFNCNYRLAPRYGIDDMLDDALSAFRYIVANAGKFGGDGNRIIFAGDSAGAHILSLLLNRAIRDGNEEIVSRVKGCAFFYGVYNLNTVRDTGFKLLFPYLNALIPPETENYEEVLKDNSPIHIVSEKHPPTLICCGEVDKLTESQSKVYLKTLEEKGVKCDSLIFPKECQEAEHRLITYADCSAAVKSFEKFKNFISKL